MAADSFPTSGQDVLAELTEEPSPAMPKVHQSLRVTREMNQQRMGPEREQR